MADLTLAEWDGLLELIEVDLSRWGLGVLRFCNSSRGWDYTSDGSEEPTEVLDLEFITWQGNDYRVLPFRTKGWRRGGDGVERPSIDLGDMGAVIFNQLRAIGGAKLAPVKHYYLLAADVIADNGNVVGVPQEYMINRISANGMNTQIELGTHSDTTRTTFPPFSMTERDFPGLRNRYDRA